MGMVVRTNTMALNAYRQLGMNNNAVAKSLEKLSSGFRINRAGDDAAGLAISEKMKAQITGLEAASANAQDGISLIQTAEGNLGEVHDMLNRMVELASKAANGTYTLQERQALQDEVDQLLDEIDRISESANFNGTKLLDGSLEQGGGGTTIAGSDRIIKDTLGAADDPIEKTGIKTILDGGASSSKATEFKVDFSGLAATAGAGTPKVDAIKAVYNFKIESDGKFENDDEITIAGTKYTVTAGGAGTNEIALSVANSSNDLAAFVKGKLSSTEYDISITDNVITYTAKTAGLVGGTTANVPANPAATPGAAEETGAKGKVTVTAVTASDVAGADEVPATTGTDSVISFKIGGTDLATDVTVRGEATAKNIATAVFGSLTGGEATIGTVNYTVTDNKDGTLTFKLKDAPTATNIKGNYDWDVSMTADTGTFIGNHTAGTSVTVQGQVGAAGAIANTVFKIDAADIKDGTKITVDGKTVTLAVGSDSNFKGGAGVVDLTSLDPENITDTDLNVALGKIAASIGNTTNFIVGANDKSNGDVQTGITVHKKGDSKQTYDTLEKLASVFEITTAGAGKALTLQIGDTADSFNKMSVSISDMSTEGLKIKSLDITSEEKASAAIDKIKTAINSVSTARAGMGALQNRLEHTINNLDVAAENLSSANSRIRDTDMAKEMMNYTKMNVLVQSAQAMLAQANQQPQSVLQLLQ